MKKKTLITVLAIVSSIMLTLSVAPIATGTFFLVKYLSDYTFVDLIDQNQSSKKHNAAESAIALNGGYIKAVYYLPDASAERLEIAADVIKGRLENAMDSGFTVSTVEKTSFITVCISLENGSADKLKQMLPELVQTAKLTFCAGGTYDETKILLDGSHVASAEAVIQDGISSVNLKFTEEGKIRFAAATEENIGNQIAICLDGVAISAPFISDAITGGEANISGPEYDGCVELARSINSHTLNNLKTVSIDVIE